VGERAQPLPAPCYLLCGLFRADNRVCDEDRGSEPVPIVRASGGARLFSTEVTAKASLGSACSGVRDLLHRFRRSLRARAVRPRLAVLLIVVTPFVWSLPMALMVAELATLLPEEGGYYIWVKESLGDSWAVQEAWWTMAYSIAVVAMLPLLFVTYLDFFIRAASPNVDLMQTALGPLAHWLLAVAIIFTATIVNLFGARDVGRTSKISAYLVVGSFAVLVLMWLFRHALSTNFIRIVGQDLVSTHGNGLLLGLSIIVFNYSGWDNASTYAAEVEEPQRNYPRAIAAALGMVTLGYLLPVVAGISVTTDRYRWTTDAGWPVIAQMIGGSWLRGLIAAAGLVSVWALVNALLFYPSRIQLGPGS